MNLSIDADTQTPTLGSSVNNPFVQSLGSGFNFGSFLGGSLGAIGSLLGLGVNFAVQQYNISEAKQALAQAGLPEYALYTHGYMPTNFYQVPGTSYTTKVPIGASFDWAKPSTYNGR